MQERLARLEVAVRRSLELLRAGLAEDAQRELAGVAAPGRASEEPSGAISEMELEEAFEAARPDVSEMRDADQVAQEALLASGAHEPESGAASAEALDDAEPDTGAELPPSFATATMAELLESQGDLEGASRIRAGLAGARPGSAPAPSARPSRQAVVSTLERWLDNLRRERA